MSDRLGLDPPSPFVAEWITRLAPGAGRRALDVAMGRGRHAAALALAGFEVFGVDLRFEAVRDAVHAARETRLPLRGWCADLTRSALPASQFDVVVVTRYLQRGLFGALHATLRPSGVLLYETFTTGQLAHGRGPTSPAHLLQPGELRQAFGALEILCYEEVKGPDALARLVARRR